MFDTIKWIGVILHRQFQFNRQPIVNAVGQLRNYSKRFDHLTVDNYGPLLHNYVRWERTKNIPIVACLWPSKIYVQTKRHPPNMEELYATHRNYKNPTETNGQCGPMENTKSVDFHLAE